MKKISYICNRCNQEIKDTGSRIIPNFFDILTDSPIDNIAVKEKDMHFCMDCTKAIMEELEILPEKNRVAKNEDKSREKEGHGKAKTDIGKVMALHKAGWTDKAIAEEMGMTEMQVYKCIWYQKNKKKEKGG